MKVRDVMISIGNFPIVSQKTILKEALTEMGEANLGLVCIVNESQELLGLITDGDLRRSLEFNKFDRNTFTVFEDIQNKDYLNISYKLFDIIFSILIIIIFYNNNIIKIDYSLKNNLIFILLSVFVLILNQILKNSEVNFTIYLGSIFIIFIFCISFVIIRKM